MYTCRYLLSSCTYQCSISLVPRLPCIGTCTSKLCGRGEAVISIHRETLIVCGGSKRFQREKRVRAAGNLLHVSCCGGEGGGRISYTLSVECKHPTVKRHGYIYVYCQLCNVQGHINDLPTLTKSFLPSLYPLHHSHNKIFQALYRFFILQVMESWAGPGNEAR